MPPVLECHKFLITRYASSIAMSNCAQTKSVLSLVTVLYRGITFCAKVFLISSRQGLDPDLICIFVDQFLSDKADF
jgi:hypothetical protein